MITDADIKRMKQVFVTKEDFKKDLKLSEIRLDGKIDRIMKYIDFKLEPIGEFKAEFTDFKESVLKTLDWLVGAFKKFDEELTIIAHRDIKFEDKLENHEIRIKNLETNPVFQ